MDISLSVKLGNGACIFREKHNVLFADFVVTGSAYADLRAGVRDVGSYPMLSAPTRAA